MSEKLPEIWQDPAKSIGELLLEKGLKKSAPALSQIPLLSLAIAAYKSKGAISDYLLGKKVQKFYSSWEQLEEPERHKIYQKLQKKPKAFVEKLLLILAQQEDMEKCRLIGYLTSEYLRGELKRADYLDLLETVAQMTLRDLLWLGSLPGHHSPTLRRRDVKERYATIFVSRGLLETERLLPKEQRNSNEPYYSMTEQGKSLAAFVGACHLKEVL